MLDVLTLCLLADYFKVTTDELLGRKPPERDYFMVCDDSMYMCSIVSEIIRVAGYDAKAVDNSTWLFNEIAARRPKGILLDVHFPKENGLDILKRLKEEYPDIRVMLLTVDMSEEVKKAAEEYGADGFVYKPFSGEQIDTALQEMREEKRK